MKECLIVGMALGFIVGAVLVQGNKQVENMVQNGKELVNKKIKEMTKEIKPKIEENK